MTRMRVTKRKRTRCFSHVIFKRITPIGMFMSYLLSNQCLRSFHNTTTNKQLDDCHMPWLVVYRSLRNLHCTTSNIIINWAHLNHSSILTSHQTFLLLVVHYLKSTIHSDVHSVGHNPVWQYDVPVGPSNSIKLPNVTERQFSRKKYPIDATVKFFV